MLDSVLLSALGLAAGAGLALSPTATALAIASVASCLGWSVPAARSRLAPLRAVSWPALGVALLMAAVGAWRSHRALDHAYLQWLEGVESLPSPRR